MRRLAAGVLFASLALSAPALADDLESAIICEAEPDLSDVLVSSPSSEPVPLTSVPDDYLRIPVLVEGQTHSRMLALTNTSEGSLALTVRVRGVDVPDYFTGGPSPLAFMVGASRWQTSPASGGEIAFPLSPLAPGETRELEIATTLVWTDDLVAKTQPYSALYKVSIGATSNCLPAVADDGPAEQASTSETQASGELPWTGASVGALAGAAAALLIAGMLLKRARR